MVSHYLSAHDPLSNVDIKTELKPKRPSMYKVLMLNDDYTPMEFVVYVLRRFFGMSEDRAQVIMLEVHTKNVAKCGVYTYEIAESKVSRVLEFSQRNQYPLRCVVEKE